MANRHMFHISKLEDFKDWLVKDGWKIEEPKGIYEVLRARNAGRKNPLIVYTKADAKEHLSLMDRDSGVVGAFLRDCKKSMTNADRIHSMSYEELAEFLKNVKADYQWVNPDYPSEDDSGAWVEWLQSEVEE